MKKAISIFLLTVMIILAIPMGTAMAQDETDTEEDNSASNIGTFLPGTELTNDFCIGALKKLEAKPDPKKAFINNEADFNKDTILACAIKTGRIKFWMVPYFVVYIIDFLIKLSGLIAVLFIVIGGYKYVVAGATDDKDGAKSTITNSIIGLVVVLTAWAVINMIQFALTF
ncbi:pilin [Patescibacteria group bacterium]|nr:pilin [Patescibacteria group bacterium]